MPRHLGHHPPSTVTTPGTIPKVVVLGSLDSPAASPQEITRRCAVCVIARPTHLAFTRPNPSTLPSWVSTSVSNRLTVLVLTAALSGPPRRPTISRIVGQPFSVVGILVARQTTVHRLPEKAHQSVLHVTTAPTLLQTLIRHLRQSQCIVQLAAGQQPSVRGDGSAAKLQPYTAVETERGAGVGAFTHWAPPGWLRYQELHSSLTTRLPLTITTVLCYSATLGVDATVYGSLRG